MPYRRVLARLRSRKPSPLRRSILRASMFTTGVTLLTVSLFHNEMFTVYSQWEAAQQLQARADLVGKHIESYLGFHSRAIRSLSLAAQLLPDRDNKNLAPLLADSHGVYNGFLTMLVTDARGAVLATHPLGKPGITVADRAYFRVPMASHREYVSPVFRGRILGTSPIVAISAPVLDSAKHPRGVVEGSLNLDALQSLELARDQDELTSILILDRNFTVVYRSAGLPFQVLTNVGGEPLVAQARAAHDPVFPYTDHRGVHCLVTMRTLRDTGWRVLLQYSLASTEAGLERYRMFTVGLLILMMLLSFLVAEAIGMRFTYPLEVLARVVSSFDPATRQEELIAPDRASSEVLSLFQHCQSVAVRLRESYDSLHTQMAELERSRESAQAADRAKSLFLANMSHELRTPLNGVIGMSELLLYGELPAGQREQVQTMRRSADWLLRILDDILDTARLENGRIEIRVAPFDLRQVIDDVVALHFPAARSKGLAALCSVAEGVPAWVEGDATRLRQVLTNLLGNAVKFTAAGRVAVEITAAEEAAGRASVEFSVADTGIGISAAAQEKLFKPFSQAHSATNRLFGGTGLGLAISAQLVELMGGRIVLESGAGGGTRFSFRLPFQRIADPGQAPGEIPIPVAAHPLRVLVAEDHPVNQLVARRLLEKLGYTVDLADDGECAVRAAGETRYAAILMDCQMPGMDGFAATAEIRRQGGTPRVPIVAITANAMEGDRELCLAAGMDDFLAKPLQLAALAGTLRRWTATVPEISAPPSPISPGAPASAAEAAAAPAQTRSP